MRLGPRWRGFRPERPGRSGRPDDRSGGGGAAGGCLDASGRSDRGRRTQDGAHPQKTSRSGSHHHSREGDDSAVAAPPDPSEAGPLRRDQDTGPVARAPDRRGEHAAPGRPTETQSVRATRVRGRIEAAAAPAILVEDELHQEAGFSVPGGTARRQRRDGPAGRQVRRCGSPRPVPVARRAGPEGLRNREPWGAGGFRRW